MQHLKGQVKQQNYRQLNFDDNNCDKYITEIRKKKFVAPKSERFYEQSFFLYYPQIFGIYLINCQPLLLIVQKLLSQTMFQNCMNSLAGSASSDQADLAQEPLKFKLLKSIKLMSPLLEKFLHPNKKEKYTFDRQNLIFLEFGKEIMAELKESSQCFEVKAKNITSQPQNAIKKQNLSSSVSSLKTSMSTTSFQSSQVNQIPVIHILPKGKNTEDVPLFFYCHGSGSTLNNIHKFGMTMSEKYGIAFIAFDYPGEGQSKGQFSGYYQDFQIVLSWALSQGYQLNKTIFGGYSIGSYPVLKLSTEINIPKILISPICGIIPLVEGTHKQYKGELYDNLENAKTSKGYSMLVHAAQEMVPIQHSKAIIEKLVPNNAGKIEFYEVEKYNHLTIPNFLISPEGQNIVKQFVSKTQKNSKLNNSQRDQKRYLFQNKMKVISQDITITKRK